MSNLNQGDNQPDASMEVILLVPEGTQATQDWHEFKWKWPIPAVGSLVNFSGVRFKVVGHEWFYEHLQSGISTAQCQIELELAQ